MIFLNVRKGLMLNNNLIASKGAGNGNRQADMETPKGKQETKGRIQNSEVTEQGAAK